MWKLWHKLFGWEFAVFRFNGRMITRRIYISNSGQKYASYYGSVMLLDGEEAKRRDLVIIK